jgi:acetyl-CoA carboxylase carboxyl transferase subunit beta
METRISTDLEENTSLWHKCTGCQEFAFKNELERNLYICSYCGALFPLLAEKRLQYLLDDLPTTETISTKESGLITEGTISGFPACLFIADIDVIPAELNASFFLIAIESALQKQIPLITIIACQPNGPRAALAETTYLTMQMERLADTPLPHITVLTETDVSPLATYLPVGELVIAEGIVPTKKSASPNLQPALHAPEEQLLTQPPTSEKEVDPDISVDCYVPREELPNTLGLFLKFFK